MMWKCWDMCIIREEDTDEKTYLCDSVIFDDGKPSWYGFCRLKHFG